MSQLKFSTEFQLLKCLFVCFILPATAAFATSTKASCCRCCCCCCCHFSNESNKCINIFRRFKNSSRLLILIIARTASGGGNNNNNSCDKYNNDCWNQNNDGINRRIWNEMKLEPRQLELQLQKQSKPNWIELNWTMQSARYVLLLFIVSLFLVEGRKKNAIYSSALDGCDYDFDIFMNCVCM